MKNLIDELHDLDEVEFKVSEDFSKNVMKRIQKEENISKVSNKVIPWASLGIAACLAVVVVTNANVKINLFDAAQESANNSVSQASVYEDKIEGTDNLKMPTYDFSDSLKEEIVPESTGDLNTVNDSVLKQNAATNVFEEIKKDDSDSATIESVTTGSANRVQANKEKLSDIKALIEKAKLEVEEIEDGLKVKASKDKVKDVLIEYTEITIETQNEYVIVRCK